MPGQVWLRLKGEDLDLGELGCYLNGEVSGIAANVKEHGAGSEKTEASIQDFLVPRETLEHHVGVQIKIRCIHGEPCTGSSRDRELLTSQERASDPARNARIPAWQM